MNLHSCRKGVSSERRTYLRFNRQRRSRETPLHAFNFIALLCVALTAFSGCARPKSSNEIQTAIPLIKEYSAGGDIRLLLTLDHSEPTVADRILLTLEATAPESVAVEFPNVEKQLGDFAVVEEQVIVPSLVQENLTRHSRVYVLEPLLAGDYVIPPLRISALEKEYDEAKHVIATDEISIRVCSLLSGDPADAQLREIAPPVELPKSNALLWCAVLGAFGLAVGLGLYLRHRQADCVGEATSLSVHEWALQALERLHADQLVEKGQIKAFYQAATDILRRYIEIRFGLHATEQTTREFLQSLGGAASLQQHKQSLAALLTHCDLVKFAEHQPSAEDVQNLFECCRTFIIETHDAV